MRESFFSYTVLRPWLWRWHRRAGLVAAIVLIAVTGTGLVLNHTSDLALARKFVEHPWLLSLYGIPEPKVVSFQLPGAVVSGVDDGALFWGDRSLAACGSELVGAVQLDGGFVAACRQALLVFDAGGALLERIGATYNLPTPIERLGRCGNQLCLGSGEGLYTADIERLSFERLRWDAPSWSESIVLSDAQRQPIDAAVGRHSLSWEKVMLDLHTGRLFGSLGVWVVDIAAVLLLFLALSGAALWFQRLLKTR